MVKRITRLKRRLLTAPPVKWAIRRSKTLVLPGFQGLALFDVIGFLNTQLQKEGINIRAAAISFNILMAVPPFMIFLFTLVPYLPGQANFVNELLKLIQDFAPNKETFTWISDFIIDFTKPRGGLLSLGFLTAAFFASNAMQGIMNSFDRSLNRKYRRKRTFFQARGTAILLTFFIAVLFMVAVLLIITQGTLLQTILHWMNIENETTIALIGSLRWVVIVALIYFAIGLIYKYAPAVKKKWSIHSPGTVLTTFLIIVITILFSYWVNNFGTYNKVYGSIGTLIIIMSTFFFNSLMLLIGFELNVSINHLKLEKEHREHRN